MAPRHATGPPQVGPSSPSRLLTFAFLGGGNPSSAISASPCLRGPTPRLSSISCGVFCSRSCGLPPLPESGFPWEDVQPTCLLGMVTSLFESSDGAAQPSGGLAAKLCFVSRAASLLGLTEAAAAAACGTVAASVTPPSSEESPGPARAMMALLTALSATTLSAPLTSHSQWTSPLVWLPSDPGSEAHDVRRFFGALPSLMSSPTASPR